MKNGIYLDQAATTFPKAPGVADSIVNYISCIGANVNRGAYESSHLAENVLFETRSQIADLLGAGKPEQVVFTRNITESLNVLIKGFLKPGDHVIISSVEHNAVMRPLHTMMELGVEVSVVPCDSQGRMILDALEPLIQSNTTCILMTHASNVSGTLLPLAEVGSIAKKYGIRFIVDSAQTAGVIPCSLSDLNADAIAFTGHKALLGPQGIGGIVFASGFEKEVRPLIEGGTGSRSDSEIQPELMPDKFEAGTPNIPGIYGLNAALKFVLDVGADTIHQKEMDLTEMFLQGLLEIDFVRVVGMPTVEGRTAVVSLDFIHEDNGLVSSHLEQAFDIKTRCGLQCAPSAHRTLETFPKGTVRFSFGYFNTFSEVEFALKAIKTCKKL